MKSEKALKILFLGGAKRVSMARLFKKAGNDMGLETEILSYEISAEVPIACEATVIIGKRWSDPNVVNHLLECVCTHNIDIVVPFVDGAVAIASKLVEAAHRAGVKLFSPVSSARLAESMFDKVEAARMFDSLDLPIPPTYSDTLPCTKLIAKPRHGSASKGLMMIDSADELQSVLTNATDYLIQERIDNRKEYTIDCYVSVDTGEIVAAVPRERLEVQGGEVTRTVTVDQPDIDTLARLTLTKTGLRGAVTIQIIRDLDCPTPQSPDGRLMIMEINPRLGGGAVCAVHAGANLPAIIIGEALGHHAHPTTYTPGTLITRYPAEVVFHIPKTLPSQK